MTSKAAWRWVLSSLPPYTRPLTLLALLSVAEVGVRLLLPWPLKTVIDSVVANRPLPADLQHLAAPVEHAAAALASPLVIRLALVVLAGVVIQLVHQFIMLTHTRRQAALGSRLVLDLRERVFAHLQGVALIHHDARPASDAVYRLEADSTCLEQLVLRSLFPLVFSVLTLLSMLVVLVTIDWRLALASLGVVPLLLLWMGRHAREAGPRSRATREAESEMVSQVYESLSGIRLVKSFGREPHERGRFRRAAGAVMTAHVFSARQEARFGFGVGLLTTLGTSLVLFLGGLFVLQGTSTPGTLLLALTYLGFVYGPLSGIASTTAGVQHALASATRVRETLRLPREDHDVPGAIEPDWSAAAVEFQHVTFSFEPGRPVLSDVSFRAEPGQLVALVGPSGSGKTTLASLIPRFREPESGVVVIGDLDARRYTLAGLRRQVAIVLQEAVVLSGSVADNLRFGRLDASDADIEAAARLANAHEFIAALPKGYATPLRQAGRHLSGGQQQRLSIARAFVKNAPIVILDEPTAALDAVSEQQIVEALERLRAGRTMFVIAHRLSTVRHADRILVLDGGRIVGDGTHDALLGSSAVYARLARAMAPPATA